VPMAPEDYVHRIGRTGRAGNSGRAITLVAPVDELSMCAIERMTGQAVERILLPAFGGLKATANGAPSQSLSVRGGPSRIRIRSFRPRRGR